MADLTVKELVDRMNTMPSGFFRKWLSGHLDLLKSNDGMLDYRIEETGNGYELILATRPAARLTVTSVESTQLYMKEILGVDMKAQGNYTENKDLFSSIWPVHYSAPNTCEHGCVFASQCLRRPECQHDELRV